MKGFHSARRALIVGACVLPVIGVAVARGQGAAVPAAPLAGGVQANLAQRTQSAAPAAVTRARADLRAQLGTRGFVSADERTGALRAAGRFGGFLTGPSSAAPRDVALGWVRDHRSAVGLGAADVDALKLAREYRSIDGVTHLIWQQTLDGVPLVDADLRANVTDDGRLVNVLGGGARAGLRLNTAAPAVGARTAYAGVLRSAGSPAAAPAIRRQAGPLKTTDFAGDGSARLVAYTAGGGARLAWRTVVPASENEDYDALVDAQSGEVIRRANLVKFANGRVHDNFPGAAIGGAQVDRSFDAWLAPGAATLTGNNAHAFLDVADVVGTQIEPDRVTDTYEEAVPAAGEVGPSSGRDWLYPLITVPDATGNCPPAPGCTWNHLTANSWQTNARQATTQLFYFVNKFHDHLAAAPIGFDEASGNFQRVNASGQGKGLDPVLAQADDGAGTAAGLPDPGHRNNANFDTRPDGTPGRMQMYLFRPGPNDGPFAAVNGSDDPQIVYHEFTHGLSNRLITDAQGFGALDNQQAGSMGEAWSDWYALDFIYSEGLATDAAGPGDVDEGAYVDGGNNLIRTEPTDCAPDSSAAVCPGGIATGPGGYTYGDFGKVLGLAQSVTVPEVHADGEIWGQTLWQLRAALIAAHGADGIRRAEQIITGGMRLGPPEPTYLDERNAILQADTVAGNGDQALIWRVFASRGMGYFASTTGDEDVAPREDFSLPPAAGGPTGTLRGTVRTDGDAPLPGARVGLAGHDTPDAGPALQAVTAADGSYMISGVPQGAYADVTVDAPAGYGDLDTGPVTIGAAPVSRDFVARRNYADINDGAAMPPNPGSTNFRDATQYGCGPAKLFDGDPGTAVDTFAPMDTDDPATAFDETAPRFVTIRLADAVSAAEIWIDPTAHCGSLYGSSLGTYEVSVSADGTTFTTVSRGTFGPADLHRLNRVPINQGAAVPNGIRFVRLTAIKSLAGPDEELDPLSDGGFLGISELQVFSTPAVIATPTPTPQPTVSPTPTPTPTVTPPPTPGRLKPSLISTPRRIRPARSGTVTVRVKCVRATSGPLPARCSLALALTGRLPGHRRASTLASRRLSIAANKTVTIRLTLSKAARKALKRRNVSARLKAAVSSRATSKPVRLLRRR